MIPMLTDEEISRKLAPLKGERYARYNGIAICWRGIGDVLGISKTIFYELASGRQKGWSKPSREKISEFLYRYERGEVSIAKTDGKWHMVFHKEPLRRDRLISRVEMTPDGPRLIWVQCHDSERMEVSDSRVI